MKPPNRREIESLILTSFQKCPFCGASEMRFAWGQLVPKTMTCRNCNASWVPFMSYDGAWSFVSAKLASVGTTGEGTDLLNKMYPPEFWKKTSPGSYEKMGSKQKLTTTPTEITKEPEKVVIIREVIKIRCPYCGGLYDEVNDSCPYCGGKR